jgi:hypothetical protein
MGVRTVRRENYRMYRMEAVHAGATGLWRVAIFPTSLTAPWPGQDNGVLFASATEALADGKRRIDDILLRGDCVAVRPEVLDQAPRPSRKAL